MMARIRTIKPEFFSSPDVAKADPWTRLAYIGMWCYADEFGRAEWTPRGLLGFVFPQDGEIGLDTIVKTAECFGVLFYINNGRRYYEIPSWDEHQKRDSRMTDRLPHYDDKDSYPDPEIVENTRFGEIDSDAVTLSGENAGMSVSEQRNIGTEEHRNRVYSANPETDDSDLENEFKEFWDTYPRKKEKARARKAYKQARKHTPPDIILEGARRYAQERTGQDAKYTKHPATWLNNTCWEDEPDPASPPSGRETIQQLRQRKLAEARAYDQAQAQQQALSDTEQRKEITA